MEEARQLHASLIRAREQLGLAPEAIDERVRQPGWCARFELSNPDRLSVTALARYARALGGRLRVEVEPEDQWWTTGDVARFLGVTVGSVSAYRQRGRMPQPDRVVGQRPMWKPERIITWDAARRKLPGRRRKQDFFG